MKFKTTSYHFDLLNDNERVSAFYQAIQDYDSNNGLVYDLGCGSGVLSYFLASKFNEVISIEIDKKASDCAKENLSNFDNVTVVNTDALNYQFTKDADLIVCEMLDTALIDEEQVPVINHAKNWLKESGTIIPQGIINTVELVNMERPYVHWDENAKYESYSEAMIYSQFDFKKDIEPEFQMNVSLKSNKDGIINGIKITTYTLLNENLVAGPTPMLNPPLLIPLDERHVKVNDFIDVELKYIMGNGIESIETKYL